ncbi:MAG: porin, partial [Betaproteobacteria bacterium]|nr:porin [Betaproteobacteria bacterium]
LVAVASLLYLGTSFADATLYGNIDQTYNSTKTTVGGTVTNQQTSIGSYQMGDSFLGVKGEEDLGGGMKASYLYEFGLKTESNATPTNRQSFVGLSGGFGALRIGKQYSNAFMNTVSADPGGATGGRGALYLYSLVGYDATSDNPLRQDRGFQYDLPTFVPGLKLGFTKTFGNSNSAATNSISGTETNGVKVGDGQGFSASYSSGGLYAGFTSDTAKGEDILYTKLGGTGGTQIGYNAADTETNKLTTFALSYDLGMAKPSYMTTKMSAGTATLKTDMFALNIPLGAASIFISSSSGKLDASGTSDDLKMKGMQYGVNYALSKRTVAYWHAGNDTITTNAGVATKTTGFGL